jgi:hypothetical protein
LSLLGKLTLCQSTVFSGSLQVHAKGRKIRKKFEHDDIP